MATPGQFAGGGGVGALGGRILTAVPGATERSSLFTSDNSPTTCQALWKTEKGLGGSLGPGVIQETGSEPVRCGLC